jgi:hypothetical protein
MVDFGCRRTAKNDAQHIKSEALGFRGIATPTQSFPNNPLSPHEFLCAGRKGHPRRGIEIRAKPRTQALIFALLSDIDPERVLALQGLALSHGPFPSRTAPEAVHMLASYRTWTIFRR